MSKSDKITRQRGSAFDPATSKSSWERCTVIDVYPDTYSCDVYTETNRFIAGLPWPTLAADPNGLSGSVHVPRRGQALILSNTLSEPMLHFSIPALTAVTPPTEHRVFHDSQAVGGKDAVYSNRGLRNYRNGMPADVQPGDWIHVGTQGNLVGVLDCGVSVLKATELAQVIVNPIGDKVQVIGRNMDVFSDFGSLVFVNDGGHTSMSLRGGSHQTTEASPGKENFTIRADLGYKGDLVDFRLTDPSGSTVAQTHWDVDGSQYRFTDGSLTEVVNQEAEFNAATYHVNVSRDVAYSVGTNYTEQSGGNRIVSALGNIEVSSGNDAVLFGTRDVQLTAGRFLNVSVSGNSTNTPGSTSYNTVVTNGSWVVDIGNPAAGDLQSALSGFQMNTYNGDMIFNTKLGRYRVKTTLPDSIVLGGQAPVFHAMLYEVFETFMKVLGKFLDSHTHLGSPPGVPTSPPTIPIWANSSSLLPKIKSNFVALGG